MASIVIPSQFSGFPPSSYFAVPDVSLVSADPWGCRPRCDALYAPLRSRCRRPFHTRPVVVGLKRRMPRIHRPAIWVEGSCPGEFVYPSHQGSRLPQSFEEGCLFDSPRNLLRLLDLALSEEPKSGNPEKAASSDEKVEEEETGDGGISLKARDGETSASSRAASCDCAESCLGKSEKSSNKHHLTQTSTAPSTSEESGCVKSGDKEGKVDEPFSVSINVGDFRPEHVNVSIADGRRLIVRAKHREEDDGGRWIGHREIEYSWVVPESTPIESLTSNFGTNGLLSIAAVTPEKKAACQAEAPSEVQLETQSEAEQTTEVTSETAADDREEQRVDPSSEMEVEDTAKERKHDEKETEDGLNTE